MVILSHFQYLSHLQVPLYQITGEKSSVYCIFLGVYYPFLAATPHYITLFLFVKRDERVLEDVPTGLDAKDLLISLSSGFGIPATLHIIDSLTNI